MKRLPFVAPLVAVGLLTAAPGHAQLPKPEKVVQVRAEPAQLTLKPGGTARLTLVATIQDGFHVNSHKPTLEYLIPTRVELLAEPPFVLEKVDYPAGELKSFGFAPDEKLSIYEGTLKLPLRLRARPRAPVGAHTLRLAFHYQACNDRFCLRPAQREVTLNVRLQ